MSERWIIIWRNTMNNTVGAVVADDSNGNNLAVFESEEEAHLCARDLPICQAYPYSVVEVP